MLTFIKDNARWIGGGFLLTLFSSFGQTFFIGQSNAELRALFDLSHGGFALLYGLATAASAASLPFLGRTLDVMPGYKVARFVIPALAGACLLIAFAPHVLVLGLALYLLRLFGQGMMTHIALTETGRWFASNRGRAVSLVVPGHQAGEALLPLAFTGIAAAFGWRWGWIGGALLLILVVLPAVTALLRVEREPQSEARSTATTARDWTRAEVLRDPAFYILLTGVLAPPFIGTTVFFHQDYLTALRGYPEYAFPTAFPLMAATTVSFALLCGALIDRFGAIRLLPFFLLPLGVASLAVGAMEAGWGLYAFMVLLGVSYGFTSTLLGALWPEIYGLKHLGGIRAIIVAAMVLSTALGPVVTGVLIDAGIALPAQMLAMAVWAFAAAGLLGLAAPKLLVRAGKSGPVEATFEGA